MDGREECGEVKDAEVKDQAFEAVLRVVLEEVQCC